jgi:hypothetical protein
VAILLSIGVPAAEAETPKRGGTLAYMIPADAPPSFDGHREATFATVHAVAPFYSVLIRVNPENPASTTDFVCDVCTEIPEPADGGHTYGPCHGNRLRVPQSGRGAIRIMQWRRPPPNPPSLPLGRSAASIGR